MTQVDHPPPIISVQDVSLVRGVVSSGGSPYPGHGHSVRHAMTDQLRVGGVSYEPSLPPLAALSPTSFLFLSSDSGFVSLYSSSASLSSRPPAGTTYSASSSLYTSSFTPLSSSASTSSLLLTPLSYPPRPSILSPAAGVSAPPPPPPGFPPLPPGFPPLSSSSSLVSSSFSTPLSLSSSSLSSASLPSFVSSTSSAPALTSASSASSGSSSSSSLDYASYKAHVLGISDEYLSLARWYNSVDGSDFFSFLSSHCPHLSTDVAKDFSSGSSILLSTLRSSFALVSGPPASTPGALPSSLFSSAVSSSGGVSSGLPRGFVAAPVSSAGFFSSLPSGSASVWSSSSSCSISLFIVSSPSFAVPCWWSLGFTEVADPVPLAAPAYVQPGSSLFHPFDASSAGPSSVVPPSLPLHGSFPVFGSAPLSGVPPPPAAPLGSSFSSAAPGPSFAPPRPDPSVPDDAAFDPDFADPSALGPEPPLAPPVLDSVRAEIRRMYSYVVDLFPQAAGSPPPPRALFEDFFVASPSSTHLPVFLDWFARVRTSLSEADAHLASLSASGRPDSSLLLQRMSQYAVHGDFASSSAVPVNPSLLSMFERSLRSSLQLGISLREAALMESSSRFHSEALSFFVAAFCASRFCSSPRLLSLILLSLLCLSAWLTRPLSLLLSLPSLVSSAVTSISPIFLHIFLRQISERCWLLLWFVPVLSLLSLMWLACWRTPRLLRRCALSRR